MIGEARSRRPAKNTRAAPVFNYSPKDATLRAGSIATWLLCAGRLDRQLWIAPGSKQDQQVLYELRASDIVLISAELGLSEL